MSGQMPRLVNAAPTNAALTRDTNRVLLLRLIHSLHLTTRTELAEVSRLSPSSVSKLVRRLIQEGLVEEVGTSRPRGGRPAVQLLLRRQARFAIGAEFSLERTKVVVTDLYAAMEQAYEADPPAANADSITECLCKLIRQALVELGGEQIVGIGIAVPGVADRLHGVMEFYSDLNLHRYPLGARVKDATGVFPVICNRVMAGAMGEKWQGEARAVQSLFYLSLGDGIGGGLILYGEPYLGASMAVAEIGHIMVVPNGPLCICGNRGCLQTMASSAALVSRIREQIKVGSESSLAARVDRRLDMIDGRMVLEAARDGDALALRILAETSEYVGIAVGSVVNLISPERIVLSGSLIDDCPELWVEMIRSAVTRHALAWPLHSTSIVVGRLGKQSRSIGAAALAIDSWLKPASAARFEAGRFGASSPEGVPGQEPMTHR